MKAYHAGLILLLLAPGAAAAGQGQEDGRLLAEAQSHIRQGDPRTALILLKKAVRANPDNAEALFQLGRLEFASSDFAAAEADLVHARDHGAAAAQISPLLASTYLAEGKYPSVLNNIVPCADDRPCAADVLAVRARAYLAMGDIDKADRESLAALQAEPSGPMIGTTRALILLAHKDRDGAERLIDGVLADNPRDAAGLTIKGDLRRQADDVDAALRSYRAALAINPTDITTRQSLALTLMAKGQDVDARTEIEQVLARSPKAPLALYIKAVLLVRGKKFGEALEVVHPAEAEIAAIPQGSFLLALIHAGNHNLEEALAYAQKFHAEEPETLSGATLLATIDFRLGAFAKVIAVLAPLRERLAGDGAALDLLGSSYLAEGQVKEANDLFSLAVQSQPSNLAARAHLAIGQSKQSATRDQGIRALEGIVLSDPANRQADLALVSSYLARGDDVKAIGAATTMVEQQPDSPLPLTLRGAARMADGDTAGARRDFDAALAKNPDFGPAAIYRSVLDARAGQFDEARQVLDALLKRNPTHQGALLARAAVEERAGHLAAATPYLEAAIRADPAAVEPRLQLMRVQSALGDPARVVLTAVDLARLPSASPAVVDIAARTLIAAGKIDEGLGLYRRLEGAFAQSPAIEEHYGQALASLGRQDEARTVFDHAIATDPHNVVAWDYRVALEQKVHGLDAALIIARKAKAGNPDSALAAALPGDLLLAAGKLEESEDSFRQAYAQRPGVLLLLRLAQALARRHEDAGVDRLLTGWLKLHPDDEDVRGAYAGHLMSRGNDREAAAQYEAILLKLPHNVVVLNNLAWTYGKLHDARALGLAQRAYALSSDSPSIIDTYGFLLYQANQQANGAALIRRAYTASPADPQVAYHMAKVLADGKDSAGAHAILKALIESKVPFSEGDAARALYVQLGGS